MFTTVNDDDNTPYTYVIGHKNPDTDSIAAAAATAELKKLQGMNNVIAACAGLPLERTEFIFKKFGCPLPELKTDVYPRVKHIMSSEPDYITRGNSLLQAISILQKKREHRLPVVDEKMKYQGMLSLFQLLEELLYISKPDAEAENSLTGRKVRSSISLIKQVLNGSGLSIHKKDVFQDFEVFVAAMNVDSFKEHIPRSDPDSLAIVVGDRAEVHLMAINYGARLIIVTGSRRVDDVIVAAARDKGVSIIKTPFDSATVIRRLKFSSPVEASNLQVADTYMPGDRICDIKRKVLSDHEDIFPVVDDDDILTGTFRKSDIDNRKPIQLILVDHNEFDQAIDGVEEVPVMEIIDHHRFAMPPTPSPLKITCDIVGSTCTLITEMFLNSNIPLSPSIAGVMMGGIITDTLMLKSPTSTIRDKHALEELARITGEDPEKLTEEIFQIGSLINKLHPEDVLTADKKNFHIGNVRASIAQVEEVSFDEFHKKQPELYEAAEKIRIGEGLDFFCLLVTNIVRENSILLIAGRKEITDALPYRKLANNLYDLPGILSRKKQLLPQLNKVFEKF
ncbi:MAG: putative manganese-dependent inorganic diphosphatase [Victivallales bacterium]|nr:putative manganese-dependent inorganic diphosphatase [Victivallales bacterium]